MRKQKKKGEVQMMQLELELTWIVDATFEQNAKSSFEIQRTTGVVFSALVDAFGQLQSVRPCVDNIFWRLQNEAGH